MLRWHLSDRVDLIETEVAELLNHLQCLPLAITQAASYINERGITVGRYLELFRPELLEQDYCDPSRHGYIHNSVFHTWKISFDQIQQQAPRAAEILFLVSMLDKQSIPARLLLKEKESTVMFDKALGLLKNFSLIQEEKIRQEFSVHRLVQLSTQLWLDQEEMLTIWQEKALDILLKHCPSSDSVVGDWNTWESISPHIAIIRGYRFQREEQRLQYADITSRLGRYYEALGRYEVAVEMEENALNVRQELLGQKHPSTLTSMNNLALVLSGQGKYAEAEEMCRQVSELRETVLGKEHPDTLTSMNNLAEVLSYKGTYKQAEEIHREVLKQMQMVLGEEHASTLTSMHNLAGVLSRQRKYAEAEEMHQQVFRLQEAVLGKEHPDTLISMNNLAVLLSLREKYEQAEEIYRQVLGLRETVLGREHPDTLTSMNNLAVLLGRRGKYRQAEEIHQAALGLRKTVLGKEHPGTLTTMDNLAIVLSRQGKYEQAEEIHLAALGLRKTVPGKEPIDILTSVNNLAVVLSCGGKYEQAEEIHRQILRSSETMLRHERQRTLMNIENLANYPGPRTLRHRQISTTPVYEPLSDLQPSSAPIRRQIDRIPMSTFSNTQDPDLEERMRDVQVSPHYLLELKAWKFLVEYLDSEFDRHSPVDDIVILVSDESNAWCTTCKEYVGWKWGIFGVGVLDFLNFLLAQKDSFYNASPLSASGKDLEIEFEGQTMLLRLYSLSLNGAGLTPDESQDTASICVVGPEEAAQTAADVLAWILSALAIPPKDDKPAAGEDCVVLRIRSQPIYTISSLSRRPGPLSDSTCWQALFPRKVVASGSVPPRPPGMKGLEINYSLLVQLSGVDLPVLEKEGLYLDGYNSALYPISYSDDKRCLQWHLSCRPVHTLTVDDGGVLHSTDTSPILYHGEWYKTQNLTDLEAPERHFVGWCASAIVTLGTDIQDYKTANWSQAKRKADSIVESSTNLNLNLSFHGIGATAGKTYKRGRNERNAYEDHEHNFLTSLVHAKQSQILLYCPSTLRGWLVPKASVLLHLVLMWMVYMKREDSSLELPLYYAAKSYDGGENAYQVLKCHGTDPLPFGDGDKPYRLINVVRMFLFAMGKLQQLSAPEGHTISGWELCDLVDPPEFFEMKEAKFRRRDLTILGGWNKMLPKIPMVLFYEGLEDPIIAQDCQLCTKWTRMPPQRNLLGVTLISLKHFTRRFQSGYLRGSGQLTDKCYWHCPGSLFEECECGERCTCERVQMIYLHDRGKPPSVDMLTVGSGGAVIFEPGSISWHSIWNSHNAQ
jgi:tetratricopeptide (TPR) repeat protein